MEPLRTSKPRGRSEAAPTCPSQSTSSTPTCSQKLKHVSTTLILANNYYPIHIILPNPCYYSRLQYSAYPTYQFFPTCFSLYIYNSIWLTTWDHESGGWSVEAGDSRDARAWGLESGESRGWSLGPGVWAGGFLVWGTESKYGLARHMMSHRHWVTSCFLILLQTFYYCQNNQQPTNPRKRAVGSGRVAGVGVAAYVPGALRHVHSLIRFLSGRLRHLNRSL